MAKKTDQKTLALVEDIQSRKAEIAKLEKPNWRTNCSFSYEEGSSKTINIHVESSVKNLVCIAAFLIEKQSSYMSAALHLKVEAPAFTWSGFSVTDWLEDIKTRINKLQISAKKKKLDQLETRLNAIISPELKAELELQAIEKELA
jgi:hypothetical protein